MQVRGILNVVQFLTVIGMCCLVARNKGKFSRKEESRFVFRLSCNFQIHCFFASNPPISLFLLFYYYWRRCMEYFRELLDWCCIFVLFQRLQCMLFSMRNSLLDQRCCIAHVRSFRYVSPIILIQAVFCTPQCTHSPTPSAQQFRLYSFRTVRTPTQPPSFKCWMKRTSASQLPIFSSKSTRTGE